MHFTWGKFLKLQFIENQVSDDGLVLGVWHVRLKDQAFTLSKDSCSHTFNWNCIMSIELDEENIYLILDNYMAIPFPLEQTSKQAIEFIYKFTNIIQK